MADDLLGFAEQVGRDVRDLTVAVQAATGGADGTLIGGGGAGRDVVVGGTGHEGTSILGARADHGHAIPMATASSPGAMSAADKAKLDSVDAAKIGAATMWSDVLGKPSTFPPAAHQHVMADIRDAAAEVRRLSHAAPPSLGEADLNTITTPGAYIQHASANATSERNYPTGASAGLLVVYSREGVASMAWQLYFDYRSREVWMRSFYSSNIYEWRRIDGGDRPTEQQVQALISTETDPLRTRLEPQTLTTEHLDTITTTGDYLCINANFAKTESGYPIAGIGGWLQVVSDPTQTFVYQRMLTNHRGTAPSANRIATRSLVNGEWGSWRIAKNDSDA